jgi:hypothetical protein
MLLLISAWLLVELYTFIARHDDRAQHQEDDDWIPLLFLPVRGCLQDSQEDALVTLLIVAVFPSVFIACFVWPLWVLSLQLGTVLAADDLADLVKALDPTIVDKMFTGPTGSSGANRWYQNVEIPGAMMVKTLEELSVWCGNALFYAGFFLWKNESEHLPRQARDKRKES